jgi:hypothetical protein
MHTTVGEIAAAEKINPSYLTRVLRLTLLAPDIVEAILDVWQPAGLQLDGLLEPFPVEWERQRQVVGMRGAIGGNTPLPSSRVRLRSSNDINTYSRWDLSTVCTSLFQPARPPPNFMHG